MKEQISGLTSRLLPAQWSWKILPLFYMDDLSAAINETSSSWRFLGGKLQLVGGTSRPWPICRTREWKKYGKGQRTLNITWSNPHLNRCRFLRNKMGRKSVCLLLKVGEQFRVQRKRNLIPFHSNDFVML